MRIVAHSAYRNGLFTVNDATISTPSGDVDADIASAWRSLGVDHPRFHRADRLSRLTMLAAAPFFMENGTLQKADRDLFGLVLMGRHGCMDTDVRYFDQVRAGEAASPALFVYTLPNIAMGELTIQHGLHGPGICLLSDAPDIVQMVTACTILLKGHGMRSVICGWADIFAGRASATFLVVDPEKGATPLDHAIQTLFDEH